MANILAIKLHPLYERLQFNYDNLEQQCTGDGG